MSKHQKTTLRPALFHPTTEWDRLTPEQQKELGMAALIVGAADSQIGQPGWNWDAALGAGLQIIADTLAQAGITDVPLPQAPNLAAIGVPMCHFCGCTDECGCAEGCSWAGESRCSSCEAA